MVWALENQLYRHYKEPTGRQLREPGKHQTDIPHLIAFTAPSSKTFNDDRCSGFQHGECDADFMYSRWSDQFVCDSPDTYETSEEVKVDFVMMCSKPYFFNSGSHRVVMGAWYKGDRFFVVTEEGKTGFSDVVSITPLTMSLSDWMSNPNHREEDRKILAGAVKYVTGYELSFSGRRILDVYQTADEVYRAGCRMSTFGSEF